MQGYGWLQPTQGALQFMQCLTQAITTSARKNLDETKKVRFIPYSGSLENGLSFAEVMMKILTFTLRVLSLVSACPRQQCIVCFILHTSN